MPYQPANPERPSRRDRLTVRRAPFRLSTVAIYWWLLSPEPVHGLGGTVVKEGPDAGMHAYPFPEQVYALKGARRHVARVRAQNPAAPLVVDCQVCKGSGEQQESAIPDHDGWITSFRVACRNCSGTGKVSLEDQVVQA